MAKRKTTKAKLHRKRVGRWSGRTPNVTSIRARPAAIRDGGIGVCRGAVDALDELHGGGLW